MYTSRIRRRAVRPVLARRTPHVEAWVDGVIKKWADERAARYASPRVVPTAPPNLVLPQVSTVSDALWILCPLLALAVVLIGAWINP